MMHRSRHAIVLVAGLALLLAACSTVRPVGSDDATEEEERRNETRLYTVQLYTTPDKSEADTYQGRAVNWWDRLSEAERPQTVTDEGSPVTVFWSTPYYRVRLGPFASRERAAQALTLAREQFPDAFIAPTRVEAAQ